MDTFVTRTNFNRPYSQAVNQLRAVGLRPTRQRLALAKLLFDQDETRHVSAEALHAEAVEADIRVSLATVYNTLHQFVEVGLLQEVVVDSNRTYFDTNTSNHHHFYEKSTGLLIDIPERDVAVDVVNTIPQGMQVVSTEVVFRLEPIDERATAEKAVNDN